MPVLRPSPSWLLLATRLLGVAGSETLGAFEGDGPGGVVVPLAEGELTAAQLRLATGICLVWAHFERPTEARGTRTRFLLPCDVFYRMMAVAGCAQHQHNQADLDAPED